jgi:hypothetical protein
MSRLRSRGRHSEYTPLISLLPFVNFGDLPPDADHVVVHFLLAQHGGIAPAARRRSYQSSLADSCITLRALDIHEAGAAMVDALRDEALFFDMLVSSRYLGIPR